MKEVQVINRTRGLKTPLRVGDCRSFFCRLRGLTFRRRLDEEEGLLLVQARESRAGAAIHMFFVGFDIGVVWLDRDREIVDVQLARSWRPAYSPAAPACYILEIHPNRLPEFLPGERLDFE